jgi:membrane-bound lytic murein transglycosylase D
MKTKDFFKKPGLNTIYKASVSVLAIFGLFSLAYLLMFNNKPVELEKEYLNEIKRNHRVFSFPLPASVNFAGEKIPIENFDVKEGVDREILVNVYWTAQTFLAIKRASRYFPIIEPILKKNAIPDDFKYLAVIESNLSNAVSGVGAAGFWQFMKESGKEFGLEVNDEVDERYNIEKSTVAACKYLRGAYQKFGSWLMAAASYNMGKGALERFKDHQGQESIFDIMVSDETTRYIYRAVAMKLIMGEPQKYGFYFRKRDLYPQIATTDVKVDTAITDLASFAISMNSNYKMLKYFNPWLKQRYLKNKEKKEYILKILHPESRNILAFEASLPKDSYLFEKNIDTAYIIHDSITIIKRDTVVVRKKKGWFK